MDYNSEAPTTKRVFATVQNKPHYAIHGHTAAEIAKSFAESEFEKYRIIQDRLYESDFDRLMNGINEELEGK